MLTRQPCITRESYMYISIMWVHIKYTHIDSLAHAHSNIKDATQRLGFKQRGGTLLCYFKACHLFEAKLALRLPYPYFSPQLSFNQPMQMHSLPIYLSVYRTLALSALIFVGQQVILYVNPVKCINQQLCKQIVG